MAVVQARELEQQIRKCLLFTLRLWPTFADHFIPVLIIPVHSSAKSIELKSKSYGLIQSHEENSSHKLTL